MVRNKVVSIIVFGIFILFSLTINAQSNDAKQNKVDNKKNDSVPVKNRFKNFQKKKSFFKKTTETSINYDYKIDKFVIVEKIGDFEVSEPLYLTPKEYEEYRLKKDVTSYFKDKFAVVSGKGNAKQRKNLLPKYYVNSKFFQSVFGGNEVDIKTNGQISVKLGAVYQKTENPQISIENQSSFRFDFDQKISASLQAKIGSRLKVNANYDTNSTFGFQNIIKLEYTPDEDDILQKLDAGNVNLPIKNSLIDGAQTLFGARVDLKFGNTTIRTAISQQNSQAKNVVAKGGAVTQEFEFRATNYDNDRHFFLGQFFRESYAKALQNYPLVTSPVNITRVEVWVTNRKQSVKDYRSIVALADIGEIGADNLVGSVQPKDVAKINIGGERYNLPSNETNNLNNLLSLGGGIRDVSTLSSTIGSSSEFKMTQGLGYTYLQNARKLDSNEYSLHPQLGYISLNSRLNDGEVLAVAYEYTVVGASNGKAVFKVGEFSNDGITPPKNIAVKLLRSEMLTTTYEDPSDPTIKKPFPTWRLMMKNIYAIGTSALNKEGFRFEVLYRDDENGVLQNSFQNASEGELKDKVLLNLMNIDKLDQSQYQVPGGDGFFDYVEGITVNSQKGLIIFPTTEPFGNDIKNKIKLKEDKDKFSFDELYLTTKIQATNEYQNKDKFFLKGYYKAETASGISLNAFNIPRGSVTVSAGGRQLVEGVDYVVDYQMGKVQILDPSLEASGVPINARVENNTFFSQQRKTFIGVDIEHKVSNDFVIGGTFLNVNEKPITPKINFGSEPINNIMLGLNFDYGTEVPYFTRLANKLPFVETEVPSKLSIRGDFAYLVPGSPSGIDVSGTATSYVDDFEQTQVPINLSSPSLWRLSSTPLTDLKGKNFGGENINDLSYNYKRAKFAWYNIDQLFYSSTGNKPSSINDVELSRDEIRRVSYAELFPNTDLDVTQLNLVRTLDLAYYPSERGPYNFNTNPTEVEKSGKNVKLIKPEDNWGGIMCALTTNNFEQSNIEYVQFWLLDPYENYSINNEEGLPNSVNPRDLSNQVGSLRINLGNLSEDILADGFKQYENGLSTKNNPSPSYEGSVWGKAPKNPSILYSFSNDEEDRKQQDIGLDGLNDEDEKTKFPAYKDLDDPAGDNFQFFRGKKLDEANASLLMRYKNFNGTEGNSPTIKQSSESFPTSANSYPDTEDINKDQTMNTTSGYFEYDISMNKSDLVLGKNNIVDVKTQDVELVTGETRKSKWYLFRIPIRNGNAKAIGGISDFNSIRFMRMYMTGFKMPVVLRLGELELVGGYWRRYTKTISEDLIDSSKDLSSTELNNFEVGVASVEQNNSTYAMPPGISRELLQGTSRVQRQNEQSVTLKVSDLQSKQARTIYKNIQIDLRRYKNLRMYLHANATEDKSTNDDDISAIIRLGTDLNDNYYEVEKPLKLSKVSSKPSSEDVWPEENNLDIMLNELANLKLKRDGAGLSAGNLYKGTASNGLKISVKGNPTLRQIRTVMLGLKNTSDLPKSAEVWFNELRSVGFDNKGGWATVLNADTNFADVANFSMSGRVSTVGFGSVEQRVQERSLEEMKEYSVATNVQLGKVMPKKWNMQIPFSFNYGEQFKDPKYNPQYQDLSQEVVNASAEDFIRRKSENSQDYTKRRGVSFINVKKNRNPESKSKPKAYDVENLTASYSYNEEFHKDYNIKSYVNENLTMGAGYNFGFEPWTYEPFKKSEKLKNKYFKIIKDFNINLTPKSVTLNSKITRNYNTQQSRNTIEGFSEQPMLQQRRFMFDWDYSIAYDLTKSLQFNFTANTNHIYDGFGRDKDLQIFDELLNIGRKNHYHQLLNGTYKIPIDKIPFLNFVTADYAYTADFDWQGTSKSLIGDGSETTIEDKVGNMIQNSNKHQLNANLNFQKLYKDLGLKKMILGSKSKKSGNKFSKITYDLLTSIKKVKVNLSHSHGTLLQGYKPSVSFLGRDSYNGTLAPNLGFVFGSQAEILNRAISENWLVSRSESEQYYNQNYNKTSSKDFNYNLTVRPLKNVSINITGNNLKTSVLNSQLDVIDYGNNDRRQNTQIKDFMSGNYTRSHYMLGTMFTSSDDLFNEFLANRAVMADRLAKQKGLSSSQDENVPGYKVNGQQAMLPAFLAAYSGQSAKQAKTSIFKRLPAPNWNLRFKGLMKYKWFKKNFSSFALSHGYKSSYTIANFTNNLQREVDASGTPNTNLSNNYQPELLVSSATLIDMFSPLIRVEVKMRNSLSLNSEVKKDRSLTLNLNNNILTDIKGTEYMLGLGYKIRNVKFNTKFGGKKVKLKGDVDFRLDVSLRNKLTLLRSIDEKNNQITGGENIFGLKFRTNYNLNKNLTASFYYNHNTFEYAISTTFPRQSVNAGINLVYKLN